LCSRDIPHKSRSYLSDHRGYESRIMPRRLLSRHLKRHLAEGDEVRGEATDHHRGPLARLAAGLADELHDEPDGGEVALGAAALEGQLRAYLPPAFALLAHEHVVGHDGVLEVHLVEVMTAREVDDGPDADARRLEVDEELREPLVLLVRHHLGPEERDGIVRDVGVARPDLGAVDAIAALDVLGPRADR